jgi:hypothetical protein
VQAANRLAAPTARIRAIRLVFLVMTGSLFEWF